ncbi:MAG: cytochrome b [Mariprofundus sp.]|nr:cytochrome b [Mariprofundus sp.]
MLRNSHDEYGWVTIVVHWLMAIAIISMFFLGAWMAELNYYSQWYHSAPELHKSIGMILLFLLLFRLIWRLLNARPTLSGLWWEKLAAVSVHRLHYLLMFTIMLSGYLIPTAEGVGIDLFGWLTIPATFLFDKQQADFIGQLHWGSAWAIIALSALHSAAALKHHFIDKDMTLRRMLGLSQKNRRRN